MIDFDWIFRTTIPSRFDLISIFPHIKWAPFDTDKWHGKATVAVMDVMLHASPTAAAQPAPDTSAVNASNAGPVSIWDKLETGIRSAAQQTGSDSACRLLRIPATSVASERLFSTAGDVVTKKRNSVVPGKAKQLVFLMENW